MIRLGSNSPTRAIILNEKNIDFIQNGGNFDEDSIQTKNPKSFVYQATLGKYNELYKKYGVQDMPLIVADSVVTANGELLRKAKNRNDAKRMLKLQSNNKTSIITCMIYKSQNKEIIDISITTYQFSKFKEEDLEQYLDSQLYKGKAGAVKYP